MVLHPYVANYLLGPRFWPQGQSPMPIPAEPGNPMALPTDPSVPPATPTPVSALNPEVLAYFKQVKPELFSSDAYDAAQEQDREQNRVNTAARGLQSATALFTNRPPDYAGLEPTNQAVKVLLGKQELAQRSMAVGGQMSQITAMQDKSDPTSAVSRMFYRVWSRDPIVGPKLAALGPEGAVSQAIAEQVVSAAKTGGEMGETAAKTDAAGAAAGASRFQVSEGEKMLPGKVEGQRLGNLKTKEETAKLQAETAAIPGTQARKSAEELRKEWTGQADYKSAQIVADAWEKIKSAPTSGAGDVALLYGYMKILDPNSAVREGEVALGKDTGSIPDAIVRAYNKAVAGEQFTPEMRQRFLAAARETYNAQVRRFKRAEAEFGRIATANGIDPTMVLIDTGLKEDGAAGSAGSGAANNDPLGIR